VIINQLCSVLAIHYTYTVCIHAYFYMTTHTAGKNQFKWKFFITVYLNKFFLKMMLYLPQTSATESD